MFTFRNERSSDPRIVKIAVERDSTPVAYSEALQRWRDDEEFRASFIRQLAEAPFSAFRWETPPITIDTAVRPFEFVLLDSPGLDRTPDVQSFADHFSKSTPDGVVEFANLGRDAILVVPSPLAPESAYGHLVAFVRHAPIAQQHALWKAVGAAMQRRLNDKPVWLSTAGAGVTWLHVRLDDRPKYYGYAPYREGAN
jgi:hypothetical protein